jgi:transposase
VPQVLLPLIPDGATAVNDCLSIVQENGQWTYFYGLHPVFAHGERDRRSFRMFTAQMVMRGMCQQGDIVRTFGVSKNSVKRSVKKYREEGIGVFYRARRGRGGAVLTAEVLTQVQGMLERGLRLKEAALELGLKYDTVRKAVKGGRLRPPPVEAYQGNPVMESKRASDKSARSVEDAAAEMGVACTRPEERVLAAFGMLEGAPVRFEPCRDVSFGGVLSALPALAQNGLFEHLERCFPFLRGYYTTVQVVVLLAYMALCRIKTVERLQYEAPGELGKLLGLDRVPEVRCLRQKLTVLSKDHAPEQWAGLLSQDWLEAAPELAGTLYVDGHVRLYHGHQTVLPRRYVSRQRLCLRGTTDYWVNDALGQPFFVVERPVDQGLLEALQSEIVPRLLQDVPHQPTEEELQRDPYGCRFVIVFDRAGYSPEFFKEMWQKHRIACLTYHKYPKGAWPEGWFRETPITLPNGEAVSMKLAEMGSWVGEAKKGLWVREVRKLTQSGHQTSLISTAYSRLCLEDAAAMFSRWSQENFFRYMMEHFAIDLLSEYQTEEIPGTARPVVNPLWRELDSQVRSLKGKLTQRGARFAALTLHPEADPSQVQKWEQRKAALIEEIQGLEHEWEQVKQRMKETPRHLKWDELPKEEKFERLAPSRKRLMDTIKMIAYRAETAMAGIVRDELARSDDARALLRDLFRSEADLVPNIQEGVLRVDIHPMANARSNRAVLYLLDHLNAAAFTYPGTNLQLVYSLVGASEMEIGAG